MGSPRAARAFLQITVRVFRLVIEHFRRGGGSLTEGEDTVPRRKEVGESSGARDYST